MKRSMTRFSGLKNEKIKLPSIEKGKAVLECVWEEFQEFCYKYTRYNMSISCPNENVK